MTILRIICAIILLAILSGCTPTLPPAGTPPSPPRPPAQAIPPPPQANEAQKSTLAAPASIHAIAKRVFFATDRNQIGSTAPSKMFGTNRSNITYGICDVSIPGNYRRDELESPPIWSRWKFRKDLTKYVVLLQTEIASKDEFFTKVAERVRRSKASNAFLFIHGYNITFEEAAKRTAQMAHDLGFDGAPTFYSWPSQGSVDPIAYTTDENNIEWSQANIRNFLEDFFARSKARNIYLIAHGMGNRALTRVVVSLLADKPILRRRLKEVILAAPDIDADVFKRDIAPALAAANLPVTLYVSSKDRELALSKKVHGGYARAGNPGRGMIVAPGIETVDATQVDTGLIGRTYYAEAGPVLTDICYRIRDGKKADERFGLRPVRTPSGRYWVLKPWINTGRKKPPDDVMGCAAPGQVDLPSTRTAAGYRRAADGAGRAMRAPADGHQGGGAVHGRTQPKQPGRSGMGNASD